MQRTVTSPPRNRLLIYPDSPPARRRTIAADAATVVLVVLFALLGLAAHHSVGKLASLGDGVAQAGGSVQQGFNSAAQAVSGAPVIGGQLSAGLSQAGAATGGQAKNTGLQGASDARELATLLGWLTFLIPTLLVLQRFLPARARQVQHMAAAAQVLDRVADDSSHRLVAERAVFSLPYKDLLRHTSDPLGDLKAGRLEPLVAAALEDAGLSPRRLYRQDTA